LISRSLRTFWAVHPPHPVIESLAEFVDEIKAPFARLGLKVAWLKPPSMHITLKFLGTVDEAALPAMVEQVQRGLAALALAPIPEADEQLVVHGLSAFPDVSRPRVLIANLRGAGLTRLSRLQQSLEDGLAELGHVREERPFHSHLTLGRVRDAGGARGRAAPDLSSLFHHHGERRIGEAFPIEEVTLYESRLDSDGAIYVPVHTLRLDGQPKENVGHGN